MEPEVFDIPTNSDNSHGLQTQSHSDDEGKAQKHRGSRCLVSITLILGLVCLLLSITVILQYFMNTAERDTINSCKNTVKESNQTMFCLHANFTKSAQKKLDVAGRNATSLSDGLKKNASTQGNMCALDGFIISLEFKTWSDSRQFCRDHGADLVMIKSEEKQRLVTSIVNEKISKPVWIGLSDTESEGNMKWVDNSRLSQGFWMKWEPNDASGNEDCVKMNPKSILENWNDIPCSEECFSLCEY